MFSGLGKFGDNIGNFISREEYDGGYALYVLDVEGKEGNTTHSYLRQGHTRLELLFSTPLPKSITVLLYGTFPAALTIDESSNVQL